MGISLGEARKEKLRALLKEYGVTKCYVSVGLNFDYDYSNGGGIR